MPALREPIEGRGCPRLFRRRNIRALGRRDPAISYERAVLKPDDVRLSSAALEMGDEFPKHINER